MNTSGDDHGKEDEDEELDEEDENEEEEDEGIEVYREPFVYDNLLKKLEASANSQANRHKEMYILLSLHYIHLFLVLWLTL